MDNIRKQILKDIIESSSSDDDEDIFDMFFDSTSSSDESSEDQEEDASKCNFMNTVDAYSEEDFKSHLRLKRSTIENLILTYSQSSFSPSARHGGRCKIGPRKEVYIYIWYISNTITFRQVGNLFGVPKSSAWIAVRRVSDWLVSDGRLYIKWPQGDAVAEVCKKFEARKKIPGVIGAIGCTHIIIAAPRLHKECYYNRKDSFSIILQAVVDADNKFIDICCGEPGSLDDNTILRRSALYKKANSHISQVFPSNTFILGDSSYPDTSWLVSPFKDSETLTEQQRTFNYLHSSTRIAVDNTFKLLKGRFRRLLRFTEQRDLQFINKIIVSACILHNICISVNDHYSGIGDEENDVQVQSDDFSGDSSSTDRRQHLLNNLIQQNVI